MSALSVARIPFSIRMAEEHFRGEAIGLGDTLKDFSLFEVRLNNGEMFLMEALPDNELRRINWASRTRDHLQKIAPVIGRVIERYFTRKKA
jgi:hypothetical protein